jgi:hypothetical protein
VNVGSKKERNKIVGALQNFTEAQAKSTILSTALTVIYERKIF